MAGSFARSIPTALNTSTLGLLKTCFVRNLPLNFPHHSSGYRWGPAANLLVPCRYKSGVPFNIGSSTGKGAKNGVLYGPLQIGKQSKRLKFKRKPPNISAVATKYPKGVQSTFGTPAPLVNAARIPGSFLPSLNAKPEKLNRKNIVLAENHQHKTNLRKTRESYEHVLYNPKKHNKSGKGEGALYDSREPSKMEGKHSVKKLIFPHQKNSRPEAKLSASSSSNKGSKTQIKPVSSKTSTAFILVGDGREDKTQSNIKANESKTASRESFHKEVDVFIDDIQLNRWENLVQKNLREVSRKPPSASFILVDDKSKSADNKKTASNEHVFLDPRDQMEDYVFGHSSTQPYRGKQPPQNVSRVPNNTAKLDSDVSIRKPEPVLHRSNVPPPAKNAKQTVKPRGIENGKKSLQSWDAQPSKTVNKNEVGKHQSEVVRFPKTSDKKKDVSGPSIDFYNKSIWSKELMASVERSQKGLKQSKAGQQVQNTPSKKSRVEVWDSSAKKLEMKKSKKTKKLKNKLSSGDITKYGGNDYSISNTASSNSLASVGNGARDGARVTSAQKQKDLLNELRGQWKAEFGQNYLNMQNERLAKKSYNPTPSRSTLVNTPSSFAQWYNETQNAEKSMNEKDQFTKSTEKTKSKPSKSLENEGKNQNVVGLTSSDSLENSRVEQQIRDITSKITKSSDQVLSRRINSAINKSMNNNNVKDTQRGSHYVLLDERLEDFAKGKDRQYLDEATKKHNLSGKTAGLFPLLDKLDGFMTMELIPVQESPSRPKPERPCSPLKTSRMTVQQQSDMLRKNHDLLETNRSLRNMLAMRRYQDRSQKDKVEKQKKKKKVRRKGRHGNGDKQQRSPLRTSKTNE